MNPSTSAPQSGGALPQALCEQMAESIAVYDLRGTCLYVNSTTERLFGHTREQLVGRNLWDVFPDARGNPFHEAFHRVCATGKAEEFDHFYEPWNQVFSNRIFRVDDRIWVIARDVSVERSLRAATEAGVARLRVLSSVSRALSEAGLALQPVLDAVVREVVAHAADACRLALLRDGGEWLDPVAMAHRDDARAKIYQAALNARPLRVGDSVSGRVAATGTSVLMARVPAESLRANIAPEHRPLVEGADHFSVIVVALRSQGRVIGTLQATLVGGTRQFTVDDQTLLEEVADRASVAIANARLHDQARLHTHVLDSMAEGVTVVDEKGVLLYVNGAFERMFGYSRDELLGRHANMLNAISVEESAELAARVFDTVRREGVWRGEIQNRRKSGESFTTRTIVTMVLADNRERFVGVRQDISEEQRSAAAMRELVEKERSARTRAEGIAERTRRLHEVASVLSRALTLKEAVDAALEQGASTLDAASCGVWLLDEKGEVLTMLGQRGYHGNAAAFERMRLETDMPVTVAVRRHEAIWLRNIAEYAQRFPESAERVRGIATLQEFSVATLPLLVEGRVIGVMSFTFPQPQLFEETHRWFVEILAQHCAQAIERTRLFEKEAALAVDNARLYAEAQQAVRKRDEFLSVASHELKTPLTSLHLQVQGLMRSLEKPGVDVGIERVKERVRKTWQQANRLAVLVEELLDASRIATEQFGVTPERADLAGLARDVVGRFEDAARDAGVEMTLQAPEVLEFEFDRTRVDQVLTNLVGNAIKYAPGRPVEVSVSVDSGGAIITVRDHGPGIAEADRARIFNQFERAVPGRGVGGLGLGLWIARKIVSAHGGSIDVESESGKGAAFMVRLPR